jgi:hypothetical protein
VNVGCAVRTWKECAVSAVTGYHLNSNSISVLTLIMVRRTIVYLFRFKPTHQSVRYLFTPGKYCISRPPIILLHYHESYIHRFEHSTNVMKYDFAMIHQGRNHHNRRLFSLLLGTLVRDTSFTLVFPSV